MATKISSVFDVLQIVACVKTQCEFYKETFEPDGLEMMTLDAIIISTEKIASVQKEIMDAILSASDDSEEALTEKTMVIKEKFEAVLEGAITGMAASSDSLNRWKFSTQWAKYQLISSIDGAAKCARELLKEMHEGK